MMGWGYGMMGGWFGMLIPLILIGVIVYAVIKLSGNSNVRNEREYDNSLAILNERFARGEINEEEYNRKKAILLRR
ncbi:SHOCT domain-containing protein [Petroclostridium sp. X23]|uniref:SHOCT domain-containing protein n=1 Tax=Petroclostridium sp. X23 TaxID=3045146 RepID=UPI0024AD6388|nr:SHOCT domain-containing protein [Petroclostridium sp. X23]WHH60147.1 SHOCT domain-containing protein [Petroclostridium sp. X23]